MDPDLERYQCHPVPMKNALEEIADEVFEQLRSRPAGFCACSQCRDDAITRALNQIRPRYISGSPIGSAVTRVALSQRQARAELSVVMLEAMRVVRTNPRHAAGGEALRAG